MYQVYNTVATDDEKMRVLLYSQKSLRRIRPLLWNLSTTLRHPVSPESTIALNKALRCNTNRTLRSTSRRAVAQLYRAQVQIKRGTNKHKPGETERILALNTFLLCGFHCLSYPYSSTAKWHNASATSQNGEHCFVSASIAIVGCCWLMTQRFFVALSAFSLKVRSFAPGL